MIIHLDDCWNSTKTPKSVVEWLTVILTFQILLDHNFGFNLIILIFTGLPIIIFGQPVRYLTDNFLAICLTSNNDHFPAGVIRLDYVLGRQPVKGDQAGIASLP